MTIEVQYLPPISSFMLIDYYGNASIEAHENYQKRSYRNRAYLWSETQPLCLTVPLVKGKNEQCPIQEVVIHKQTWRKQHWKSIQTIYGKTPFFEHYEQPLKQLIFEPFDKLFLQNLHILHGMQSILGLSKEIKQTKTFHHHLTNDWRGVFKPGQRRGFTFPEYAQLSSGVFHANLSIVDLLFHKGPETIIYLKQLSTINNHLLVHETPH